MGALYLGASLTTVRGKLKFVVIVTARHSGQVHYCILGNDTGLFPSSNTVGLGIPTVLKESKPPNCRYVVKVKMGDLKGKKS